MGLGLKKQNQKLKKDGTNMSEQTEENKLNFDPKEIEAELVRIAEERADDPAEVAAQTFRIYLPFYRANKNKLSTRALRRILDFLVLYPLESDKTGATSDVEREMMELINTLIQAKFVMILDTYRANAETLYEAANSPLTEEEATQVIADLKAGGASDEDIAAIHNKVDKLESTGVESEQGE